MSHEADAGNLVVALDRQKPGKDAAVRALIARHVPTLRSLGLATGRAGVRVQAADGTYVEMFEWKPGAAQAAHTNPAVLAIWGPMHEAADFVRLADLEESGRPFPHFRPVEGVTV